MIINYEGEIIDFDNEYSLRDFTGLNLSYKTNMSGKKIYGTCFSQEIPDSKIFPASMTGTEFYNCNLDNVLIPIGNKTISGSQRRFKAQNDLNDWLIDDQNKPSKILNHEVFVLLGLPTPSPINIPLQPVKEPIDWLGIAMVAANPPPRDPPPPPPPDPPHDPPPNPDPNPQGGVG